MTRIILTILAAALLPWSATVQAREVTTPFSKRHVVRPLKTLPQVAVQPTDVASELARDAQLGQTTPMRVARLERVELTPATHGAWEAVPGGRLWRLRVKAPGATDISLGFSRFHLAGGATLHLYSENEDYTQGAFTEKDNKEHGQLWTPVLPGSELAAELFVPDGAPEPELVLSQINRGYRDLFRKKGKLGTGEAPGPCENDVICPVGDGWRDEIRSVATYTINGEWLCTGTLINNVAGDARNFFLTANHCGITAGNAPTMVVYWNYQSPVCGQRGGGSLAQNQSGAILRMSKYDVDVALVELEDMPNPGFNVYYSGWDRSGVAPAGAVGIHHPDTSEKSISFSSTSLLSVNSCIGTGGSGTHWRVVWNSGVTEPGSSGSGIWDPATKRLVGFLSGGDSSCSFLNGPDCYGKFSVAWASGTGPSSRLRDWLDPLNTGVTSVAGLDSKSLPAAAVTAALVSGNCLPTNAFIDPGELVTVRFIVTNAGGVPFTNLVGTLLGGLGVSAPSAAQSFGTMPLGGTNVVRLFSFVATGACGGTITTRLQLQDGALNLGTFTNTFLLGQENTLFAQNFDGVGFPSLPAGWTTTWSGVGSAWISSALQSDSVPNAAFGPAPDDVGESALTSPPFLSGGTNTKVSFRHKFDFETTYDGGVLEVAIGGGGFTDITSGGGAFLSGGYVGTLSANFGNPIGGRNAWTGPVANFVTSVARLPAAAAGQSVRLRWRAGTDSSNSGNGWFVDSISVGDGATCCPGFNEPLLFDVRVVNGAITFSFQTTAGQSYQVDYKDSLNSGVWQPLQTIPGNGAVKHFTNSITPAAGFFRLRSP